MQYQSYNPDTGSILRTLNIEPHMTAYYENDGETLIQGEGSGFGNYVDIAQSPPVVRRRPTMDIHQDKTAITANGVDAITLSGLPSPCGVKIGGTEYNVTDGVLEWSTLMPAAYSIEIEAFPYLDWKGEAKAVASDIQTG
jgi:hypothetical protein